MRDLHKKISERYGWMMNRNKNTKAMLAELREEYPIDYETENIRVML